MARRPTAEPQPAILTPEQMNMGIRRLEKRLAKLEQFDPSSLDRADPSSTIRPLEADIQTALAETFGENTSDYQRFSSAIYFHWPLNMYEETPHHVKVQSVAKQRQKSIQLLTAAVELLRERLDDLSQQTALVIGPTPVASLSKRVFVVHGHDNETKEAVARFVSKLGFEPVILHEQPNRGRTIIEKFRDEAADIGFAIVLLSPDDETTTGAKRARQNVILELGFFLGRLGPSHVAALKKGEVETPSDFDGVIYTPVDDAGHWKLLLAKEIKSSGYSVDLNKAL